MRALKVTAAALMAFAATPVAAGPVATFSDIEYRAQGPAPTNPGMYRNPILPGFHPDPSTVRVGDDFYLVTSTFGWFPGIPVFHSRDLVNWELIGHAIDRPGMLDLSKMRAVADGVYAPAITWHDGTFYIFNTCVRCGGNFYVTAKDPAGPWSDPVWVEFDGIDPSLFFDDDGNVWVINNDLPEGGETYSGHRALWVQQIDLAKGRMFGPRTMVVNGGVDPSTKPVWAEGPHIFKKDGWYYINDAEGGTAENHSQTIWRSRNVTGPYVPGPNNPTLTQRDLPADRADRVEATGHADLFELADGSWWTTFLATRPFAGQSTLLGRETYLLPVTWKDGWPTILPPGAPVPLEAKRPGLPAGKPVDWRAWREDFRGARLSPEWIQLRNPADEQWYVLDRERGALQVVAGTDAASTLAKPHFLGRRMRDPVAQWTARVAFAPEAQGDLAGLMAFASEEHFLVAGIEGDKGGGYLAVRYRNGNEDPANGALVARADLPTNVESVELKLAIDRGTALVQWRPASQSAWRALASDIDVERMASIHTGLFTGVTVGPYAYAAH
ncbi:family 43 glycosylhydrolase [Altererythrobacter salegens]|uniref:Family 43 glycosylhydrolase n=1 Tax=Croceibacterium salegens TaxID=1737568 RepID=A0A6I4SW00_9SPHN|nr:glycoside hydrolase family 43 protein [Croceibacterium salegens]MXO60161.1 family 43 glycosylhydrolase [Croceibacterium salegens]